MTTVLIVLVAVMTAIWVSFHLLLTRVQRNDPFLKADVEARPPDPAPMVSVIIPARNEARNIRRALGALLRQDYPNFEVIVADDRSTDDTVRIVRDLTDTDPRVKLFHNHTLPAEWVGKAYVLQQASREARGEILFFLDADVALDPGALAVMVSYFARNQLDLLSMILRTENDTVWGALHLIVGTILLCHFRLGEVNNPCSDVVFANGQNIMIRTDVYRQIGEHEDVKSLVQEDIALARIMRERWFRSNLVYGFDMGEARWYTSLGDSWRGWTRILYGLFEGRLQLILTAILLVAIFLQSPATLIYATTAVLANGPVAAHTVLLLLSCTQFALSMWLMIRFCRIGRGALPYIALSLPASLIAFGMLLACIFRRFTLTPVSWRGKHYNIDPAV